jgi:hypothetical protein
MGAQQDDLLAARRAVGSDLDPPKLPVAAGGVEAEPSLAGSVLQVRAGTGGHPGYGRIAEARQRCADAGSRPDTRSEDTQAAWRGAPRQPGDGDCRRGALSGACPVRPDGGGDGTGGSQSDNPR